MKEPNEHKPFGYLYTMDLYNCRSGVCDDFNLCYNFLEQIVEHLQMQRQAPPFLFRSDGTQFPDKTGLSGWVALIESGIQIHTLSPKNFISIDVYSCKKFPTKDLDRFVRAFFEPHEVEAHLILRGTRYNL